MSTRPFVRSPGSTHWSIWLLHHGQILAWLYCIFLLAWTLARLAFGDRWWWLFVLNTLTIYLFVPVPGVMLIALWSRQRGLWLATGAALVRVVWLFGALFLPAGLTPPPEGRHLRVMTYNMLGFNTSVEQVIAAIEQSHADVVTLQELNPAIAAAITNYLTSIYPYQYLDPQVGVTGMGVISRYPLHPSDLHLPSLGWIGTPQLLTLDLSGQPVTLINAHPISTDIGTPARMEATMRLREQQLQVLVALLREHPYPVVLPIDANTTDQHAAYQQITTLFRDAWREAGWGLGHTFPGADSPGSSRPKFAGVAVPSWLVRIDYVFYSQHWTAVSATIGPWDGVSDHRPVIAELVLTSQ